MGRKSVSIELKKNIILIRDIGISQHKISCQLEISRQCIRRTIRKFGRFHNVAMKSDAERPQKVTDRRKKLIKLQPLRDDTCSLADLVRYTHTDLNLSISRPTISRMLQRYNMLSHILPRKSRITSSQDVIVFIDAMNIYIGR